MMSILYKIGENIWEILLITVVVVAIFMLFYDDNNTDSKLLMIEMSICQLILTHIQRLGKYVTMIFILCKMGESNGVFLHITVVVAIFLLFHDDQDTKWE